MAQIFDNNHDAPERQFVNGLNTLITDQGVKRVDFCIGYFNLRGWNLIDKQVDQLEGSMVYEKDEFQQDVQKKRYCRLLIGMNRPEKELIQEYYSYQESLPIDNEQVIRCKAKMAAEFRQQIQIGRQTAEDERTLQHLAQQLREGKVCVKLYLREPLHAKLYLGYKPDAARGSKQVIIGSSNLTKAGMCGQGELDVDIDNQGDAQELENWFTNKWDDEKCVDISQDLIAILEDSWALQDLPPYYIYVKTAYHLSQDARAGISEYNIPLEFRHDLFDFQQTAVKIVVRHLNNEKLNGAMIGDVVGLGKTITACCVARIFEDNFAATTLVLCPANLQSMWQKYKAKYNLKMEIMSKDKPLTTEDIEMMPHYRLVIIDESHNLRNREGKKYQNIKHLIEHQGCKVLLLSATPYNKDFRDLSNQLRLFLSEDADLGVSPENYIRELGGEREFTRQHSDFSSRSIRAFEYSDNEDDWNELMKLFLVRRTRSFVKEYCSTTGADGRKCLRFPDGTESKFPTRHPKSVKFETIDGDQYSRLYSEKMMELMKQMKLPRYGLANYINKEEMKNADSASKKMLDNLTSAGTRMMGFCRSTFFKRMDSSGFAFLLSLYRHALRNWVYLYAIQNNIPLPVGNENALPEDYSEDSDFNDELFTNADNENLPITSKDGKLEFSTDKNMYETKAQEYYATIQNKNSVHWIDPRYFTPKLKAALEADCKLIFKMIEFCGAWEIEQDQKLNKLKELLLKNHKNDKVLVFTQFADTATYLYNELRKVAGVGNVDYACGNTDNPTRVAEYFSPKSNEVNIPVEKQIRVLIATDVLSEGQNLQDAHVVVNYDLPWAIIRLIQRAGRVDRIGQEAEDIFCYSFFPADGVEGIIKLRARLNDRINQAANVLGSDEIFFEGNEQNLRDMYNERAGILDDAEDDVDLCSQAYQIWLDATNHDPELKRIIPHLENVVYSTKSAMDDQSNSVITYARTYNDFDVLTWTDEHGNLITNSQKRILQALACAPNTPRLERLENHHDIVKTAIMNVRVNANTTAGILGNRFSTRYKTWQFLDDVYNHKPLDMFYRQEIKDILKVAMDDIYNFPLLESTQFTLGRLFRNHTSQDDIIDFIVDAYRNNSFCRVEEDQIENKDSRIICSMGIRKN